MKKILITLMMMSLSTGAMAGMPFFGQAHYSQADTILVCKSITKKDGSSNMFYMDTKRGYLYHKSGQWLGVLGVTHNSFTYIRSTKSNTFGWKDSGYAGYHWDRKTGIYTFRMVTFPSTIKHYMDIGQMTEGEKKQWWTISNPDLDLLFHKGYRFFDQEINFNGPTLGENIGAGDKDHNGFKASDYHKRFIDAIENWPELRTRTWEVYENTFPNVEQTDLMMAKIKRYGQYYESKSQCEKIEKSEVNKF